MSNYVKLTDFASKDSLTTGNPLKLIKGSEINDEFNAIQTAVATKADLASPALLGNPTAPTQTFGNNTTRLSTTAFVQAALQALHPVGSVYISILATNPATLFGFGTWVAFAAGKTLIGLDGSDADFDTVEKTGGSKITEDSNTADTGSTALTVAQLPAHGHPYMKSTAVFSSASTQASGGQLGTTIGSSLYSAYDGVPDNSANHMIGGTGGDEGHNHSMPHTHDTLPPYVVVYMWKRTA